MQIIITLMFWLTLYEGIRKLPAYRDSPAMMAGLVLDHVLPIVCLTIDFMFNMIPFMRRHLPLMLAISAFYLIFNFTIVQITGRYVYVIFKWKSVIDFILPFALLLFGFLLFVFLEFLSRNKMYYLSKKEFVEIQIMKLLWAI